MQPRDQTLEEIIASLSPLAVEWMDETATKAIGKLSAISKKDVYSRQDVAELLQDDFEEGLLCARLFLSLSKDAMESELRAALGGGGIGVKRFAADREEFLDVLEALGLPKMMGEIINYQPVWSDILVERLRSGRGSAIQGQRRGRDLEDFVEAIVKEVFGEKSYEKRCTFTGADNKAAKCDIAIPDRNRPRIIIEVKGYGATGSKMTDIIGDLDAIIDAKRHDTMLLFVTDGTTWRSRQSDLKKIVHRQNQGKIGRIYTMKMRDQLAEELKMLKQNLAL
jgi:hypothetical protein